MLSDGRDFIEQAWWMGFFPGAAIFVTVLRVQPRRRRPARRARPGAARGDRGEEGGLMAATDLPAPRPAAAARRAAAWPSPAGTASRAPSTASPGTSPRRDARRRRRVRQRQERDRARRSPGCCRAARRGSPARRGSTATSSSAPPTRRSARSAAPGSAMVFQDPMTSLNPVPDASARRSRRALRAHRGMSRREAARARRRAARPRRHPRRRGGGSTTTRTSSPAGCGSG